MIAHLRGRILEKHPNRIVVDVGGVGYDVFVPFSTFYGLGDSGSEVALRIHTHVREDALALYGFATRLEQDLFERLIGVSGIGPKLALAVLSGIEPIELMEGTMPRRQTRLVEAWAELHQDELVDDWNRLQLGKGPLPIEPLK